MDTLLHYLHSIYPLSPELREHLSGILKVKQLSRKDYLLRAGHISHLTCFVGQGLLRCFYHLEDQEVSAWFMKEGDVIVSVESFFHQTPSKESIQAMEDCVLYYITYEELQFLYRHFMEFNFIGRVLTERYYILSEQRLYYLRMQRGKERFDYLRAYHSELLGRVPDKHLASYLGISDVYLSQLKNGR
jgi:CRP/FNR family transcriptional regulator, anaerobic regulatory protein